MSIRWTSTAESTPGKAAARAVRGAASRASAAPIWELARAIGSRTTLETGSMKRMQAFACATRTETSCGPPHKRARARSSGARARMSQRKLRASLRWMWRKRNGPGGEQQTRAQPRERSRSSSDPAAFTKLNKHFPESALLVSTRSAATKTQLQRHARCSRALEAREHQQTANLFANRAQ